MIACAKIHTGSSLGIHIGLPAGCVTAPSFPKSFSHVLWEKNVARFEVGYLDVLGTNTVDLLHVGVRFVL